MVRTLARKQVPFRVRLTAEPIRLALLCSTLALTGVLSGACSQVQSLVGTGTDALVTVQMRGGLCETGPCDATVTLQRDGRLHSATKPPNDLGAVSAESMAALNAAISTTDFAAMKARKFTGECPVAFDGLEFIFEFATPTGRQRIASCEVDIDWGSPLFVAVAAALGQSVPLPVT